MSSTNPRIRVNLPRDLRLHGRNLRTACPLGSLSCVAIKRKVRSVTSIPEPWASAMVKVGLTDPRYADARPSINRLAERANLHPTTVSRMVHGTRTSQTANVEAVADALRVDVVEVSRWVNRARSVSKPYQVPAEVNRLSDREQRALSELILAMAASKELMGNAQHPAPIDDDPITVTVVANGDDLGQADAPGSPRPTPRRQGARRQPAPGALHRGWLEGKPPPAP